MRRCLCAAALHLPLYQSLRCRCHCAAPVVLLRVCSLFVSAASTASIRKIITLDMIEYTAEYILHIYIHIYQRYQSRPHPDGEANPFQCPAASPAAL